MSAAERMVLFAGGPVTDWFAGVACAAVGLARCVDVWRGTAARGGEVAGGGR